MEKSFVQQDAPFTWSGTQELVYKDEDGAASFKDVTRRTIMESADELEVRYFEVKAGGHTTLEKHEHTHIVIPIRGSGACLVGEKVINLSLNDVIYVAPWEWHQFRAAEDEELGFFCLVKCTRDRPTLPTGEELVELRSIPEVAAFIRSR